MDVGDLEELKQVFSALEIEELMDRLVWKALMKSLEYLSKRYLNSARKKKTSKKD